MTRRKISVRSLFIAAVFLSATLKSATTDKPFSLSLLFLSRVTGTEPVVPKDCRQAALLAVNVANNRTDILPDYRIQLAFADEKLTGSNAPTEVMRFVRQFEQQFDELVYPSPILIGPLNSNGCQGIGHFLQFVNYVALSTMCTAPVLSDHKTFPNLYLSVPNAIVMNYGFVRFVKEIGEWRRCALLTFASNTNDFMAALSFQGIATQQGLEIPWFNSLVSFDRDTAISLRESGARIIVIMSSSRVDVLNFFCQAYLVGITGPRYLFLAYDAGFPDITAMPNDAIPKGCSRSVILEQTNITLLMVTSDGSANDTLVTELGYNRLQFESIFDKLINHTKGVDFAYRFVCFDATMQVALVLDKAERALAKENMSLRSFFKNPRRVMQVVNHEILNVDRKGLSTPRLKYNSRGEIDAFNTFIQQWSVENGSRKVFSIAKVGDNSPYDYESYRIYRLDRFVWETPDGLPPRDRRKIAEIDLEAPQRGLIVVCCLAAAGALFNIAGAVLILWNRNEKYSEQTMPLMKCVGLLGCLLLNFAAVVFVHPTGEISPFLIWNARVVLLAAGLFFIDVVAVTRIIVQYAVIRRATRRQSAKNRGRSATLQTVGNGFKLAASNSYRPSGRGNTTIWNMAVRNRTSSQSLSVPLSPGVQAVLFTYAEVEAFYGFVGTAVVQFGLLIAWLVGDSIVCLRQMATTPFYDDKLDIYFETFVDLCQSKQHKIWIVAFAGAHLVALVTTVFFAYDLRQRKSHIFCAEFVDMTLTVGNVTTNLVAACLILIVLANPVSQQIAVAAFSLITSLTTSVFLTFSIVRHSLKRTTTPEAQTEFIAMPCF